MTIRRREFKTAKVGDAFVDAHGRPLTVQKVIGGKPFYALMTYLEGHGQEKLVWHQGKVLDEELAILMELNCPEAKFQTRFQQTAPS